jgi:hypothetical protein
MRLLNLRRALAVGSVLALGAISPSSFATKPTLAKPGTMRGGLTVVASGHLKEGVPQAQHTPVLLPSARGDRMLNGNCPPFPSHTTAMDMEASVTDSQ